MRENAKDIDEYIKDFPAEARAILEKIRDLIRETVPDAGERIAYGIPTFTLGDNLVHFGGYKHHIGFYPTPSALRAFAGEIAKYKNSKGAVQFPLDRPVPYALIRKMVKFRVKEMKAAATGKNKKKRIATR